jgi:hypothetical protein
MLLFFYWSYQMTHISQHNRVEMMPLSASGATTMSQTESPTQAPIPPSLSELEYAVRLGLGVRAMFNRRKAGKLPPHFFAPHPTGPKQQIRYLLADVEANEPNKKQNPRNKKTGKS